MEHVNAWCFRDIYKGGLWEDDLHVCARIVCASSRGTDEIKLMYWLV